MALPNKTIERLIPDSLTILHWLNDCGMHSTESMFMKALFDVIKTCRTEPMDNLFKPLIETGLVIPQEVTSAISTFTQSITDYNPKQRKLSL